jgi:hypothetical protein
MKKAALIIGVFLVGFYTNGILNKILLAKTEQTFRAERSNCQKTLLQLGRQYEGSISNLDASYQRMYYYIDWSKLPHDTNVSFNHYPLAYDRHMSNHDGRGINVLMVNGTVIWDANAQWLKVFETDHPDLQLPMPE